MPTDAESRGATDAGGPDNDRGPTDDGGYNDPGGPPDDTGGATGPTDTDSPTHRVPTDDTRPLMVGVMVRDGSSSSSWALVLRT